ncbi:hypothetical protein PVV74_19365 [Roseovarius sp. SK2]|uniref:hypothetical protein n=1 Tax=Roseovarius TaxID=74030 RepID=UPI000CDCF6F7|nr:MULTISPECIES: hypothetical protein [Roseovarius]MDD9727616.1 hypothetical protein [Roseovarius sp. SK2]
MIRAFRLILILAFSFGAVIAPDGVSASMSDAAITQIDTAESQDQLCYGCVPAGFSDAVPCEGGCPVPCGSSGTAGIIAKVSLAQLAMPFGIAVRGAEPLMPLGINPSLDPFPPKLPV